MSAIVLPPQPIQTSWLARLLWSPAAWSLAFLALLVLGLSLRLHLPVGPNYWDIVVYLDGAHRLEQGQMPHRDFFAPVGGLSYLLYHLTQMLFPKGHALLAIQWSLVPLTLPPVLLAARHLAAQGQERQALGLLLPFMLFAAAPINGLELFPAPGFDAYGSYNRHICLLLYALTATLWLLPTGVTKALVAAAMLLALIGIKLTGFLVGAVFVVHAAIAGRLTLRQFALTVLTVAGALGALEALTGTVSAYLASIVKLVGTNSGSLLGRFFTVASVDFDTIAAGGLLTLALLVLGWNQLSQEAPLFSWRFLSRFADNPAVRIGVALTGGVLLETQNTGSQEFIFLWPMMLPVIATAWAHPSRGRGLILGLILITFVPHVTKIVHRSARATMSALVYPSIQAPELGTLGQVSAKRDVIERADILLGHYVAHRDAYRALASQHQLPSAILFSELDYQLSWLRSVQAAVKALEAHEARQGWRYNSLYTLDFADVFPALMKRRSPLHVPIGLDPYRTFPAPDEVIVGEVSQVDALLVPTCPVTHPRLIIEERFAAALAGRPSIALTPCWTLRPKR